MRIMTTSRMKKTGGLKKLDRRGQLHMTETIAVLFIFSVLVLFGIIFYYKYQQISLKEQQQQLLAAKAMDTTLKVLFLPELLCSRADAEPEDNCVDMLKLRSVNETFAAYLTQYYFELFSYAKISVMELYPEQQEFVLYDKQKPGFSQIEPTYFVVALRDEVAGGVQPSYGFGYLKVEVYD